MLGTTADGATNPAKNLARTNCGATLQVTTANEYHKVWGGDSDASALLREDDTLSYPLAEGETTFVISFPKVSLLDRFTFVNENGAADGDVTMSVSNYRLPVQSEKWVPVAAHAPFTGQRLFNASLEGIEGRYVKLTFHVTKWGRIAGLGLYGSQSLQQFAVRQTAPVQVKNTAVTRRLEDMLNFNFANLYARAHVVFVSSGAEQSAKRMIDDDVTTSFQFSPADPQPTVIIELAESQRLHRVSAIYKMEKGRLDVFVLQNLAADPGDLSGAKKVASVSDSTGGGKAALDFDPAGARYVALRWTPAQPAGQHGFEVAEISAFGEMPLTMLSAAALPEVYAYNAPDAVPAPPVLQAPALPIVSE